MLFICFRTQHTQYPKIYIYPQQKTPMQNFSYRFKIFFFLTDCRFSTLIFKHTSM